MRVHAPAAVAAVLLTVCLAGCSGSGDQKSTASVRGKVTYNGEPVTGGFLTMTPQKEGKPGTGEVGADGSFTIGTYGSGDGAVIGTHTISYSPPSNADPIELQPGETPPAPKYAGLVPKESTVVVESGGLDVTIELVDRG